MPSLYYFIPCCFKRRLPSPWGGRDCRAPGGVEAHRKEKFMVLGGLRAEPVEGGTLVFGRTKRGVRNLGQRLQNAGHQVAVLQGNLDQNARDKAMEQFRSGRVPILVATT